jgi:hypothetical protein
MSDLTTVNEKVTLRVVRAHEVEEKVFDSDLDVANALDEIDFSLEKVPAKKIEEPEAESLLEAVMQMRTRLNRLQEASSRLKYYMDELESTHLG